MEIGIWTGMTRIMANSMPLLILVAEFYKKYPRKPKPAALRRLRLNRNTI